MPEGAPYSIPNLKPGGQNFTEQPVPSIANGPMLHTWRPPPPEQPAQMAPAPGVGVFVPGIPAVPVVPAPVPIHQVLYFKVLNACAVDLWLPSAACYLFPSSNPSKTPGYPIRRQMASFLKVQLRLWFQNASAFHPMHGDRLIFN